MPHRDQRGASLLLVLALVTFLALLLPAILGLVSVGSRVTEPVREDRRATYAATSGIEAALAQLRADRSLGRAGGSCPTQRLLIDGFDVDVQCQPPPTFCDSPDRAVALLAVARSRAGGAVAGVGAQATLPFAPFVAQPVEVNSFDADRFDLPEVPELTACTNPDPVLPPDDGADADPEPPPSPVLVTTWRPEDAATDRTGNTWRAEVPLLVTAGGAPEDGVDGAQVTVMVEYRLRGTDQWVTDTLLTGTSSGSGAVPFHSPRYGVNNDRQAPGPADAVRFTVASVEPVDGVEWEPGPEPVAVEVGGP